MTEVKLGYYFARLINSDRITIVGCWGDKIQKQVNEDVEILEKVPKKVLDGKYRVLNLRSIMNEISTKQRL
jgi:tRNA A22 N-methylase